MLRGWPSCSGNNRPRKAYCWLCYLSAFHHRAAFNHTVEDSIYIDPNLTGQGLGKILLTSLIERARGAGKRQIMAVIGDSNNQASIGLHRAMGFVKSGLPGISVSNLVGFSMWFICSGIYAKILLLDRFYGPVYSPLAAF